MISFHLNNHKLKGRKILKAIIEIYNITINRNNTLIQKDNQDNNEKLKEKLQIHIIV